MSWDDQINEVRHQINELQNVLEQNEDLVKSNKQSIQQARFQVESLLNQPYNAREALFELPLVLHALTNNKLVGTLLFGPDGRVVMHNGTVQRSLGLDPMTNRFPAAIFRDADSGAPISERNLPWARCLRGETIPPSMHLSMERPNADEIVCFEVKTIPLRKGNEVSGAVALFMDLTDSFRADSYIKRLCVQLEQHLTTIETARRELRNLSDKLGEPSDAQPKPDMPEEEPRVESRRVLIADDIPVNQKLLIMQLRKFGLEAEVADNGLDAADLCRTTQFAMIFMDVDMPIMNGFEATQRIRSLEKNGRRTPIVALTSYNRIGDREKCLESGMDDYLAKGSALTRLREIVDLYVFNRTEGTAASESDGTDETSSESNGDSEDLSLEAIEGRLGDEAEEILALFIGSAMMLLNCLEYAINEKDPRAVNHFAYSIKGPCASMGLHNLALVSADLTYAAEMGRWVTARDYFNVLNQHFRSLKEQWSMKHDEEAIAATSGA